MWLWHNKGDAGDTVEIVHYSQTDEIEVDKEENVPTEQEALSTTNKPDRTKSVEQLEVHDEREEEIEKEEEVKEKEEEKVKEEQDKQVEEVAEVEHVEEEEKKVTTGEDKEQITQETDSASRRSPSLGDDTNKVTTKVFSKETELTQGGSIMREGQCVEHWIEPLISAPWSY